MIMPSPAPQLFDARRAHRYSEAKVPTAHGEVRLVVYRERQKDRTDREHVAMVIGDPRPGSEVLVRVHSECITSEVFGSQKCDCKEQLDTAIERMHEAGQGVLIYLRQEGRGIGLGNKIRAYALQERGADTIEANHALGFETDLRTFDVAASMLKDLGVEKIALMTNNPDKIASLEAAGIEIARRVPVEIAPNAHSRRYLATKREHLGHFIGQLVPLE
jgi:GTP cyclohydrolase II